LKTLCIKRKKITDPAHINSMGKPGWTTQEIQKNYRIFSLNPITDGMEAQPYSDQFLRHHILFLYRLSYLSNNTKMTKKYKKWNWYFQKNYRPFLSLDGSSHAVGWWTNGFEYVDTSIAFTALAWGHVACVENKRNVTSGFR
jgi:hypothetical protein